MKQWRDGGVLVAEVSCAEQLARFFPSALPTRIPVQVVAPRRGGVQLSELTMVEFCGPEHAVFVSSLPLEFDERLSLKPHPGGDARDAAVVAVQYHEGRKAVAVRFLQVACDWVTQT